MDYSHIQPIRVMALHALAYCERLFYLEEVEEIRIADSLIYEGRNLHEKLRQEEEVKGEWTSIETESEILGLVGKVDAIRERDGTLIPYEHKKGRPRRVDKEAIAWRPDAIQVSAYGMLLEEKTGDKIPEGRVRYHGENITVRVPLDDKMRNEVLTAVKRARELRNTIERPPVTENDRLCIKCSLAPVCLPEEARWVKDPSWEPVRLFPAHIEGMTIYVTEPGTRISRSGDTIKIIGMDNETKVYPIRDIGSLVIHGYPQITTQALHFLIRNRVGVHWLSPGGYYLAGILDSSGMVQRRVRQYQALCDPGMCLKLAKRLSMAKVEGALKFLLRATRGKDRVGLGITEQIQRMRESLSGIAGAEGIDSIRGFEGTAGRAYFGTFPSLIRDDAPDYMKFTKRSRRPPKDPFNSLLSFGYSLLYRAVMQGILTAGLEPSLGFMHTPRSSAHPLVLDLMELFRVPLWDMVLIGSVNRLMWEVGEDFSMTGGRVLLTKNGRKKAIELFEKRLDESWKHPVIDYSISYGRMIELEARLLEKEWMGEPGLFARMRIR